MADFKAKTGNDAEYTRIDSTKFLATVMTEFNAGKLQADVIQGPLPLIEYLAQNGVLTEYKSPSAAGYPDWAVGDKYYSFGIEYVGIIFNTTKLNAADAPKSYADLANPKWKDQIVISNVGTHSSTIGWLVALNEQKVFPTEADWRTWLKGLAANNPMFVTSFGSTSAPVERGEKLLSISMPKYIVTKAPAPLDWARIDPLFGAPRAIGISSKAPHPVAARQFMDYWLSADAAKLLANDVGEWVIAPGVYPPIDGMDKATVKPFRDLSDEELAKWGAEFKTIFNAK
jgi:iron(III) transport system substrate-binding protein